MASTLHVTSPTLAGRLQQLFSPTQNCLACAPRPTGDGHGNAFAARGVVLDRPPESVLRDQAGEQDVLYACALTCSSLPDLVDVAATPGSSSAAGAAAGRVVRVRLVRLNISPVSGCGPELFGIPPVLAHNLGLHHSLSLLLHNTSSSANPETPLQQQKVYDLQLWPANELEKQQSQPLLAGAAAKPPAQQQQVQESAWDAAVARSVTICKLPRPVISPLTPPVTARQQQSSDVGAGGVPFSSNRHGDSGSNSNGSHAAATGGDNALASLGLVGGSSSSSSTAPTTTITEALLEQLQGHFTKCRRCVCARLGVPLKRELSCR